jgi:hypothetical protein
MRWKVPVKSWLYLFKSLHAQLQRIYSLQIIQTLKLINKKKPEKWLHLFYVTHHSEARMEYVAQFEHMKLESLSLD